RERFSADERWRVSARIERLNELGFDVGELEITTDLDGTSLSIRPKGVDAGHHARRLLRLTGIDAQENQARRLLNDLDQYIADTVRPAPTHRGSRYDSAPPRPGWSSPDPPGGEGSGGQPRGERLGHRGSH